MDAQNPVGPAPRAGWVWYFAYGSNMNSARLFNARLAARGVPWGRREAGRLDGWQLAFNKRWKKFPGAGVANIVPMPGGTVHGTLNEMPPAGLDILDGYEGVASGDYARREVGIIHAGGTVTAVTYVAESDLADGLDPSCTYLAHLLAGRDLLPEAYLRGLTARTCLDGIPERN